MGIKKSPDNRVGAVGSYDIPGSNGVDFPFTEKLHFITIVLGLHICADAVLKYFHALVNKGFQPPVEFIAVKIDVKPLVMASKPGPDIQGSNRKNLGVHKHLLRQRQIKAGNRLLGIFRQQPAAGLAKAGAILPLFINHRN